MAKIKFLTNGMTWSWISCFC